MIDEQAAQALGKIIVAEIGRHPPLLAVAIFFETAQPHPALYLAYETAESCMVRLRAMVTNEAVATDEARLARHPQEAPRDRLRQRIGDVFNTGDWTNPADPVLLDRDAIVDAWAKRAFAATNAPLDLEDGGASLRQFRQASDHLLGTLWAAIDHARRTCPAGRWPPISFVRAVDDYSVDLITVMATRKPANP